MTGVEHFDEWYGAMSVQPDARDELVHRHLGLPVEVQSTSLLTLDGLLEVRDRLRLRPGDVLLDLGCGRGGYGMWLARDTGARLIGVDFSQVAIDRAAARRPLFGLGPDRAEFVVGELEASTLPAASVDAVVCVDAIQFAGDPAQAAAEIRRVLRPGGRAAVTCWEALDPTDEQLTERIRRVDLAGQLAAGGLTEVVVEERPRWLTAERALWTAAAAVDPRDDRSLASLRDEGVRVLSTLDRLRRVLATATAPRVS